MAVQEGPTSVRVSWTPPTSLRNTTGYRIYYNNGSSGSVDTSGGLTDNHLLTGLQNGASYTISIVGTSEHFFSDSLDYPNSIPLSELLNSYVLHFSLYSTWSVPGMPIANVSSATATTISLSWSVPNSSVDNYVVTWKRDNAGECPVKHEGNRHITDGSLSYTIEQLEEDSNYTITLTAVNAAGRAVSVPVTGMTKEAGKGLTEIIAMDERESVFFPAPSAAPTSVHTSDVTFSSITVQWGAVDCIHHNGNITGYSVRYWVQRSSTHTLNVSGGTTTAFTLTGLSNSTTYSIDVAAVNNAGIGKYSDSIMVKTKGKVIFPH